MRYLGGLRGVGTLTRGDKKIASASYDFDGYLRQSVQVTSSGEIRLPAAVLREVFGRRDLQLLTEDGRRLSLQFSEKRLRPEADVAHVDVEGDLPLASEWQH